jgi:hypothetical protein
MANILSFDDSNPTNLISFDLTPDLPKTEPEDNSIWGKLRAAITSQVQKDGILPDSIQIGEDEAGVEDEAINQIYYDVAEFYYWYFNKDDDRTYYLGIQKPVDIPDSLREAVAPVVKDNLDSMREVGEIPTGQDADGLEQRATDSLSRYILNWQDWWYSQKMEEDVDDYYEQAGFYDSIYLDDDYGDYGDLGNLLDNNTYDGVTDVPWIGEPVE